MIGHVYWAFSAGLVFAALACFSFLGANQQKIN